MSAAGETDAGETPINGGSGPEEDAVDGGRGLEGRLQRLEEIVASLEADDLDLERALALFEEGITHVRAAERILAEAELRVEELLGEGGGAGAPSREEE